MVHSASTISLSNHVVEWDSQIKKPKLDITHASTSGKQEKEKAKTVDQKYGAWGPTFKNKGHFASMHHC